MQKTKWTYFPFVFLSRSLCKIEFKFWKLRMHWIAYFLNQHKKSFVLIYDTHMKFWTPYTWGTLLVRCIGCHGRWFQYLRDVHLKELGFNKCTGTSSQTTLNLPSCSIPLTISRNGILKRNLGFPYFLPLGKQ